MMVEKVVKMLFQLIMMIILARFLGPTDLGTLMYCFALASAFIFLNTLGLENLLIKIFVERVNKQPSFLKHGLILRLSGALLCIALVNLAGLWIIDEQHRLLLFVISLYHLFMPFTVYEWFYQAQGRGDLSALALIMGHISGFVFRLVCLLLGGDLIWLGLAYTIELLLMAVVFGFIAKKQGLPKGGLVSPKRLSNLLKDASPLIISGALVLMYMKTDQLMLGYMVNEAEVGIYVAATRLSEAWYYIGLTLIGAYFPKLIETLKNKGQYAYEAEIINKGRWLIWASLLLAGITTFIAPWLIEFLYGAAYSASSAVLMATIWAVPFVYLGTISIKMYIVLNNKKAILYCSIAGLIVNFCLNYLLIPQYGAFGAGVGSLISQIFACYLFNYYSKQKLVFKVQNSIIFNNIACSVGSIDEG